MAVVRRNYINTRFTLAGLEPDFKAILESENTYNDCTFYIAEASRTGEITKIIDSSVPGVSGLVIPGFEFTQAATLKHCVIQYNASTSEMMDVAKVYKENDVWTIESSSGTKKTLAEYMNYLDIKLAAGPTYDDIVRYAWPLIDNFVCSEPFDFVPSASNKLKYVPFEASKLTEASIIDMVNLTAGNQDYAIPDDLTDTATLNLDTPGAFVRFINLKLYADQNTKNIKLHSLKSNVAQRRINILVCPKELGATQYIGFEISELDNDGLADVELYLSATSFVYMTDDIATQDIITVCYIEGLDKSLTEQWMIDAGYIYIKNLNVDYMEFINAHDPSTNIVNRIYSEAGKLNFTGESSETAKTLMFTALHNVDMNLINGYSSSAKEKFNVDGINIISGYNISY